MAGRGFRVRIEFDLHAITCPGVWLCPNGKVALRLNTLSSHIESHRIAPIFPLLFHDKFTFEKVFAATATPAELQRRLEEEFLYAELVQWSNSQSSRLVILSTFETNLVDLLYPEPCFKGLLAGVDVDLLMEPTKYFPGILAPKIEVSTHTTIEEVASVCGTNSRGSHVINPKVIHSKTVSCVHRKRPTKGIIRQKKVCHSQGTVKSHSKGSNEPSTDKCHCLASSSNQRSQSQTECYHASRKESKCICSSSRSVVPCKTSHVLNECPVCLKYNCYFLARDKNPQDERKDTTTKSSSSRCIGRYSSKDDSACRPISAPETKNDPSSFLQQTKRQQLRSKDCVVTDSSSFDDDSTCNVCSVHKCDSSKQSFYKNLERFYKRMYKQAKMRAKEVDCT